MTQEKLIDELTDKLTKCVVLISCHKVTLETSISLLKSTEKHPNMIDWLESKAAEYNNELDKIIKS